MGAAVRPFRPALAVLAGFTLLLAAACASNDEASVEESRDDMMTSSGGTEGYAVGPAGAVPGMAGEAAPAPDADKAGGAFGGDGSTSLPSVLGRTILLNGSVSLTVESVADSFDRVRQITEGAGGFVAGSSFYGAGESQSASLTLRIPAEQFDQVVSDLRGLAIEVEAVQTSSQDVTEEFTDLQSTVRNLQAVEQQYLTLLGQADNITDILQVQDRLAGVRLQIEQAQGRINMLDNLSSLATLSVNLMPESAVAQTSTGDGFGDRVQEAWDSSLEALAALGTGVAVAVVWSWWLLPLIPVAWLAWRRWGQRPPRPSASVDTPQASA